MLENRSIDDDLLKRFLLGAVPEEQAERLDELSISDDHVATRLQDVENDLVDAFVRGELSGETEQRFKAQYLSTPERRNRIAVAEALLARQRSGTRVRRGLAPWAIAASVLLVVLAVGYLGLGRRQTPAPLPVRVTRTVTPDTSTVAERIPITASILLAPPTRGSRPIESVDVTSADSLVMTLQLESDDFPSYRVLLRDLAANKIVCQEEHSSSILNGKPSVSVRCPAASLEDHNYSAELAGLPASGEPEMISGYTFRVIRKQRS